MILPGWPPGHCGSPEEEIQKGHGLPAPFTPEPSSPGMLRVAENSTTPSVYQPVNLCPRNSSLTVSDPTLEPPDYSTLGSMWGYVESETEQEEGKEGPAENVLV